MTATLKLRVQQTRWEADDILGVELRDPGGATLPAWEVGAHVDVHLPNGLRRSYSLVNPPADNGRYVVAVALDRDSSGGSRYIHRSLRPGQMLDVGVPRNHFHLIADALPVVLIAGGIGVTPLYAMANALLAAARPFRFFYACRSRKQAAFLDAIRAFGDCARLHIDDEAGALLDVAGIVAEAPANAHFYCCGPSGMLAAFESATASWPPERVHIERFTAPVPTAAATATRAFEVTLARSQRQLEVPADKSILSVLLQAGIDVPHSCTNGLCGTCETTVLAGEPEHRDFVLSSAERAANNTMMVCVSRCRGQHLTLDL